MSLARFPEPVNDFETLDFPGPGRICLIRSVVVRTLLTGGAEKGPSFSYSQSALTGQERDDGICHSSGVVDVCVVRRVRNFDTLRMWKKVVHTVRE